MAHHSAQALSQLISAYLDRGGTLERLASEVGFLKTHMITRIQTGEARLPLDKVLPFARALNVHPPALFRLALTQCGGIDSASLDELLGSTTESSNSASGPR